MLEELEFRESPVEARKVGMWTGGIKGLAAELSRSRFRLVSAYPFIKLVPLLDVAIGEIERIEVKQGALSVRASFLISLRESAWTYLFKSGKPNQWIEVFRQLGINVIESESFKNRSNGFLGMLRH